MGLIGVVIHTYTVLPGMKVPTLIFGSDLYIKVRIFTLLYGFYHHNKTKTENNKDRFRHVLHKLKRERTNRH